MKAKVQKRVKDKDVEVLLTHRLGLRFAACPICHAAILDEDRAVEQHLDWHEGKSDK